MKRGNLSGNLLYAAAVLLGAYFIIRLINFSRIIWFFPVDRVDIADYMALLFFLAKYGYHAIVPNWYNGFVLFQTIQPGWYFFTLPIYWLTRNVQSATYLSVLALFAISFLLISRIGRIHKLSPIKRLLLFLFLYANAVSIGELLRLGKVVELFGFTVFLAVALIIFSYKDKPITKKFLFLFIPSYAIVVLSHFSETVLTSFSLLSLFLIKNWRERKILIFGGLLSVLVTAFWWVPFLKSVFSTTVSSYYATNRLLDFNIWLFDNIASFLVPFALWITFYFYIKDFSNKNSREELKKEILFYSPIIILSILFISRAVILIPVLNSVFPDAYIIFFIFFLSLFLLKTENFNINIKKAVFLVLILISIVNIGVSIIHTPWYSSYTQEEKNTISLLQKISETDKFLIFTGLNTTTSRYYDYAVVYLNLSTASGDYEEMVDKKYIILLHNASEYLKSSNCEKFREMLNLLNTTAIITYREHCQILEACGFNYIDKINSICLYKK